MKKNDKKQKKILTEGHVARFGQLAGIRPALITTFLKENYYEEEGMKYEQDDADIAPAPTDDVPADLDGSGVDAPVDDVPADEPAMDDTGMGGSGGYDIQSLVTAIVNAISDVTGEPINVEGSPDEPVDAPVDDAPVDDVPADVPADEPAMDDAGMNDDEPMMEISNRMAKLEEKINKLLESKVEEEVVEEEETLEEDAAQEAKRGMPKPGTHEGPEGTALKGSDANESYDAGEKKDQDYKDCPEPSADHKLDGKKLEEMIKKAVTSELSKRSKK